MLHLLRAQLQELFLTQEAVLAVALVVPLPEAVLGVGVAVGGAWETGALDRIIVLLLVTERDERLISLGSFVNDKPL